MSKQVIEKSYARFYLMNCTLNKINTLTHFNFRTD